MPPQAPRTIKLMCDLCTKDFYVPQGYSGLMLCPSCVAHPERAAKLKPVGNTQDHILAHLEHIDRMLSVWNVLIWLAVLGPVVAGVLMLVIKSGS